MLPDEGQPPRGPSSNDTVTPQFRSSVDVRDVFTLDGFTMLIDCRWLGIGGAGRVTELLLADLADAQPRGRWLLWGKPDRLAQQAFHGASIVPWQGHPTKWFGQADLLRVPANDVAIYMHQIRLLRPGRSVTFVHDTISIREDQRRVGRYSKRAFLGLVCRMSERVITVSDWSRASILRDLRVPARKLLVASLSVDERRISRVRDLRQVMALENRILYVGRFAPHKNLRRLCRAFQSTEFHGSGGRLMLVGGADRDVRLMSAWTEHERLTGIQVLGHISEAELDRLIAASRALAQPSLEEGYGLPAVEAAAMGLQVLATRTGYATAIPTDRVTFVDPLDETSIAEGIDAVIAKPSPETPWVPRSTLGPTLLAAVMDLLAPVRDHLTAQVGE